MPAPSVSELADQAEREFGFLIELGYFKTARDLFAESSYRGGFIITYASDASSCVVAYSDMQLEVSLGGQRIFDHQMHPGFAGNMFSHEHFTQYLPQLAAEIRTVILRGSQSVA